VQKRRHSHVEIIYLLFQLDPVKKLNEKHDQLEPDHQGLHITYLTLFGLAFFITGSAMFITDVLFL